MLRFAWPKGDRYRFGSTRRRILAAGNALDEEIERDIASAPKPMPMPMPVHEDRVRESKRVSCVSVDSARLGFSSSPQSRKAARDLAELKSPLAKRLVWDRHVNIVAGRATLADRTSRQYAYVHKQVPSAAARLDAFLRASGVAPDERVTGCWRRHWPFHGADRDGIVRPHLLHEDRPLQIHIGLRWYSYAASEPRTTGLPQFSSTPSIFGLQQLVRDCESPADQ